MQHHVESRQIALVSVASRDHPLGRMKGRISRRELARHVQLVLTDRSNLMEGRDFGVVSPATWRLADLSTKHAFLEDGLGWGGMPRHLVEADVADRKLVILDIDSIARSGVMLQMSVTHRASRPPAPRDGGSSIRSSADFEWRLASWGTSALCGGTPRSSVPAEQVALQGATLIATHRL